MEWNWWVLAVIPLAWFMQNCIHEASHLLVGWLHEGRLAAGFYPWPHKHNGRWYFARCSLGPSAWFKDGYYQVRIMLPRRIAPFYAACLVAGLLSGFLIVFPSWRLWILPSIVCAIVDAVWWWVGYFWGRDYCDGKRWRYGEVGRPPTIKM